MYVHVSSNMYEKFCINSSCNSMCNHDMCMYVCMWSTDKKIANPGLVGVPFVAPDVAPDKKFADFFEARAPMDGCVPPVRLV